MCRYCSGGHGSAPSPVASLPQDLDHATSSWCAPLLCVYLGGHPQQVRALFSKKPTGFSPVAPPAKVGDAHVGCAKLQSELPPDVQNGFQAARGGRNILLFWAPQREILAAGDTDSADILCNPLTHDSRVREWIPRLQSSFS